MIYHNIFINWKQELGGLKCFFFFFFFFFFWRRLIALVGNGIFES